MHFIFSDKVVLLFDFWSVHSPAGKNWEASVFFIGAFCGRLSKPDSSCINIEWELCSHCSSDCKGAHYPTDPHNGPERGQGCSSSLRYRERPEAHRGEETYPGSHTEEGVNVGARTRSRPCVASSTSLNQGSVQPQCRSPEHLLQPGA